MVGAVTVKGGSLVEMNFVGYLGRPTIELAGQGNYANTFGSGPSLGASSVFYDGGPSVQASSLSPNASLWILANSSVSVPGSYSAVYDGTFGDTVTTGADNQMTFLQDNGAGNGTVVNLTFGSNTIFAAGADTINTGSASTLIFAGRNDVDIHGGSGSMYFVGGSGAVSVFGGSGPTTLFGSYSANTLLEGGSGPNVLVAGAGDENTTLVGGSSSNWEFANGSGPVTMYAGASDPNSPAISILVGVTGTGSELMKTSTGNALIGLNGSADTVIGGSGNSTVLGGGAGKDVYAFLDGQAGGHETIVSFEVGKDALVFGPGYGANPVASETIEKVAGYGTSDVLKLTDGTTITLIGVMHKIET
jgi:Ca2+-binding RTX toxin-like protein